MPFDLQEIIRHVPWWLLVLFRISGIFIFSPVFGSRTIPAQVKVLLAIGLSVCIYPILIGPAGHPGWAIAVAGPAQITLWGMTTLVGSELLIGLLIGYGASIPLIGVQLGGRVIDQQMGLGLAAVFNPELGEQTGIVSELCFILALTVFVILGGHRILLSILVGSFASVPPGGFSIDADMAGFLVGLLSSAFDLGFRFAAPVLCLMFLETIAMGFIAKTVPQMNILSIGFILRIIAGATMLTGVLGGSFELFIQSLQQNLQRLAAVFSA